MCVCVCGGGGGATSRSRATNNKYLMLQKKVIFTVKNVEFTVG